MQHKKIYVKKARKPAWFPKHLVDYSDQVLAEIVAKEKAEKEGIYKSKEKPVWNWHREDVVFSEAELKEIEEIKQIKEKALHGKGKRKGNETNS
jgi:hypothetical protein